MALTELQQWLMTMLARSRGRVQGLPSRPGVAVDVMEEAIGDLGQRGYVTIVGPPNLNSGCGKDVDEFLLTQAGVHYLRSRGPLTSL